MKNILVKAGVILEPPLLVLIGFLLGHIMTMIAILIPIGG